LIFILTSASVFIKLNFFFHERELDILVLARRFCSSHEITQKLIGIYKRIGGHLHTPKSMLMIMSQLPRYTVSVIEPQQPLVQIIV